MRKINEQELENIIHDVINEELQLHEATDEGVLGGIKNAAKQVGSDIKNAWRNMKQAYKYGSQAQDINKKYPSQPFTQNNTDNAQSAQQNTNSGNSDNTNTENNQAQTQTPTNRVAAKQQGKQGSNTNQPAQQKPKGNRQAEFRINPMRVSQGNRMIKQTVQQLITNYGLNYEQVYNALINMANDVKKNRNEYFPQTNESRLTNEAMDQLTEEIAKRIRKN